MLDFKNILLIFIILFLLNQINYKFKKEPYKNNKKYLITNKKKIIMKNNKNTTNKKSIIPTVPDINLLYGSDQFNIKTTFNNNTNKYQNLNILKPNNIFELTSNLKFNYEENNDAFINTINLGHNNYDNRNLVHKVDNINFTNVPLSKEQIINNYNNENLKGVITIPLNNIVEQEEPIAQKMLYDYRFLDMNKNNLEEIIKNDETNILEGKTIKEVYDDMILDYKKINQKKNPILKENNQIDGAFGESTVAVDQWYYEGDTNELSYDPLQDLQLAVNYVNDPDDIY